MTTVESLADKALDAFWHVIVEHFPQAKSGDLSPGATIALSMATKEAIEEWIRNNVITQEGNIATGYRFSLFRQIDRFPGFLVPSGLTGIVTAVDATGVWGRMDLPIPGAEQWDNQIHWQTPEEFAGDTVPI